MRADRSAIPTCKARPHLDPLPEGEEERLGTGHYTQVMLQPLQLIQPTTIAEASQALAEYGERARIYAGGAELLLLMRHGLLESEILVDVKKIERLHRVVCES